MRRLLSFLLVLAVFFSAGFFSAARAEEFPPLETPAPARFHEAPAPTAEPPSILNRTQAPDPLEGFRFKLDAEMLHIWFPNISNCDEAVFLYGGEVWLLDCASEKMAPRGVELLQRLGVAKIDKLFFSHPHYDHMEGLQVTHEAVPVAEIVYGANFPPDTNDTLMAALSYAEKAGIAVSTFEDGGAYSMGGDDVTFTFYYNPYTPEQFQNMNERTIINHQNDASAITLVEYGSRRMLFMADMERNNGQAAFWPRIAAGLDLRADLIKYPHHGNNGMLNEFWDAVGPSLAVITNNRGMQKPGIDFLLAKRAGILYTNYPERYVHLYTDGHTWVVEYVPIADLPPLP